MNGATTVNSCLSPHLVTVHNKMMYVTHTKANTAAHKERRYADFRLFPPPEVAPETRQSLDK